MKVTKYTQMEVASSTSSLIIGASLKGFKNLSVSQATELYLKLSYTFELCAVEVSFQKENGRPSSWWWETNDNDIKDFLGNFEVTGAHLPFIYLNPISPNPRIKDESIKQLKGGIEKAADLDVEYVVLHARGMALDSTNEQKLQMWSETIEELTRYAEQNSILLTVENADFLYDLNDLAKITRKIDSNWLRITFDVGHAHMRKVPPLNEFPIKQLALRASDTFLPLSLTKKNMPYAKYGSLEEFVKSEKDLIHVVHVHDYDGIRDHLAIGEGKIDFSFLSVLKDSFTGPYILETQFADHFHDFKKNYIRFRKLVKT